MTIKVVNSSNIVLGVKEMDNLGFGMVHKEVDIELTCKYNEIFTLKKS